MFQTSSKSNLNELLNQLIIYFAYFIPNYSFIQLRSKFKKIWYLCQRFNSEDLMSWHDTVNNYVIYVFYISYIIWVKYPGFYRDWITCCLMNLWVLQNVIYFTKITEERLPPCILDINTWLFLKFSWDDYFIIIKKFVRCLSSKVLNSARYSNLKL